MVHSRSGYCSLEACMQGRIAEATHCRVPTYGPPEGAKLPCIYASGKWGSGPR